MKSEFKFENYPREIGQYNPLVAFLLKLAFHQIKKLLLIWINQLQERVMATRHGLH